MQITLNHVLSINLFLAVTLFFAEVATGTSLHAVSTHATKLRPLPATEFALAEDRLDRCIERPLREQGETVEKMRQQDRLVITTPFKWISADGLKKIARPERISTGEWIGGHYRVVFIIVPERGGHSRLTIIPEIFGEPAPSSARTPPLMGPGGGPMRGVAVGSNGSLERRWMEIVRKNCGG